MNPLLQKAFIFVMSDKLDYVNWLFEVNTMALVSVRLKTKGLA